MSNHPCDHAGFVDFGTLHDHAGFVDFGTLHDHAGFVDFGTLHALDFNRRFTATRANIVAWILGPEWTPEEEARIVKGLVDMGVGEEN